MKDAVDFENDRNRIITEQFKDTIVINDTTIVEVYVVVHDTIRDTIRDTIFTTREDMLIPLEIEGVITFSEQWVDSKNAGQVYNRILLPSAVNGRFFMDWSEDGKKIHSSISFERGEYVSNDRVEWLHSLVVATRYLNFETHNTLFPLGHNFGTNHYFAATTKNSKNQFFAKNDLQNILTVNFREVTADKFYMVIDGTILYHDKSPSDSKSYMKYKLEVPLILTK
jgi:hypothetical protein